MKLSQQLNRDTNTLVRSYRALLISVRRDGLLASAKAILPRLLQVRRVVIQEGYIREMVKNFPEPPSLPGISVRRVTVEDIPLFRQNLSHCLTEYKLAVVIQDIAAGRTYYIALEDGRIVHYCRVMKPGDGICDLPLAEGEVSIGPAYTVPEARRRGIHMIVEIGTVWVELTDAGYRKIIALVRPSNTASLRANEKFGGKTVGMLTIVRLFGITVFRKVRGY